MAPTGAGSAQPTSLSYRWCWKVKGTEAIGQCDMFFRRAGILIEPVTIDQAHLARQAFHDFGKGRHAAGLNFGDCFAYALAKHSGEPLLFKGGDFRKTDISSAF
jgi:ribonuclease VapC